MALAFSLLSYLTLFKPFTDKMTPMKSKEPSQQIIPNADKGERMQGAIPKTVISSSHNSPLQPKWIPQPKIDATDRRQIEAQNEDKSHTSKETLDDIRRVHYKEKMNKELNETYQTGINSDERVSEVFLKNQMPFH